MVLDEPLFGVGFDGDEMRTERLAASPRLRPRQALRHEVVARRRTGHVETGRTVEVRILWNRATKQPSISPVQQETLLSSIEIGGTIRSNKVFIRIYNSISVLKVVF